MQQVQKTTWRQWIKTGQHPVAAALRATYCYVRRVQCPTIPVLHHCLYRTHQFVQQLWHACWQFIYFTPMFKSRLQQAPKVVHLYSGMPQILGPLQIRCGENCRISGRSSLFGRAAGNAPVLLQIGENVDIGWQNTIAVGRRVIIGDHVRLAGNVYLAGFPGHPLNAEARARGEPETDAQVGDIILEDHVWLASGVTVLAGVTIGRNSIIGAGSVVTRNIPANVIAAGVPAKVIRQLDQEAL